MNMFLFDCLLLAFNFNFVCTHMITQALKFLCLESGQPNQPLDRQFLVHELNVVEDRESASV